MEKTKFAVLCAIGFGVGFGFISMVFYFGDWKRLFIVLCMGVFVGLLAAPEFKPKLYKNIALFQIFCGAIAGLLGALAFVPSAESAILGLLLGGLLGWLAPYWLKHMPIP